MEYNKVYWEDLGVRAEIAAFAPQGKIGEFHAILHVEPRCELFEGQLARIYEGERRLADLPRIAGSAPILKRYFLSDSTNQQPLMRQETDCAVSVIQQPPLDGSKIAVWIYLQKGSKVANTGGMIVAEHNGYRHLWKMGMHEHKGDSAWQTESLLINYEEILENFGATLAGNCIRTWFFVRDVDTQYAGMVKARKENFKEQGLTDFELKPCSCDGIEACKLALMQKSKGKLDANFIEGMACIGGCIGGAGCLTHGEKNKAEVDKYGMEAHEKTIADAISVLK